MNIPQRVAFNTVVQLTGRAISVALALVSFAIITRYLGVTDFGAYSLVLTFLVLTVAIADLGTTPIGVRELSRHPEEARPLIGNLLGLRMLLAAAAALVLLALSLLLQYEDLVLEGLRLAALAAIPLVLLGLPAIVFQSRLRLELSTVVEVVTAVTGLILVILVTSADLGFDAVVATTVGATTAGAVTGYALASRLAPLRPRFEANELRRLTKASLPIGLFMVFGVVHFRVDTLLLSILKPLDDVGTYSVAYRFLEQALFIPGFFVAAVFPIIATYHATGDALLKTAIDKSFTFLVMVALPLATATFVLAPDIIRLIAGDEFDNAVRPLRVLAFAVVFLFTDALFSALLVIHDRQRELLLLGGSVVVGNIALNLILIPPFSYMGAAVATLISGAVGGIAIIVLAMRSVGVPLDLSSLPRVGAASAGMAVVLWATLSLPLLATITAGAVVYAVLAYLLGVVSRSDLALLAQRVPG